MTVQLLNSTDPTAHLSGQVNHTDAGGNVVGTMDLTDKDPALGQLESGSVYYVVMVLTRQDNLQAYLNVTKPVLQGVHWKLS